MNKRISLFLFVMLFVLVLLNAKDADIGTDPQPRNGQVESPSITTSIDLGQSQLEDSLGGLLEGTATSDGFFSISYAPDISFNKLSFQLDLKIQGRAVNDPFDITFDFSYWALPPREEDQNLGDYSMATLLHYSSFIRYIQWGDRYEPIYVRYGKLTGITLGDGALLNGFFDLDVGTHATRPGLNFTLDGTLISVHNAGFEFVTNDLFNPTLLAWRIYSRPFSLTYPDSYFSNVEMGISFAENPSANLSGKDSDNSHTRKLLAIDMGIPLVTHTLFKLAFFADLLGQTPGVNSSQPALATRFGIFGHSQSFFLFNASLTIPTFGPYYTDYFDSGFEQLTQEDREKSILRAGSMRIDTMAGLNFTRLGAYLRTRIRSDYSKGNFSNYKFQANARIDKRLFNIVSLDLSYEKLYPITTGTSEGFFEGLYTLRNVEITASTIIKIKPYSFTIGLSMVYDELAQSTLQVDTAVRISIL